MSKKLTPTLLAVLLVTFSALGTGAGTTAAPGAEPAAPALAAEFTPGPVCTGDADVEAVLAEIALPAAPAAATAGEALPTDTSWWRGICWTSCWPCNTSANCPWGETCQFGVHCP